MFGLPYAIPLAFKLFQFHYFASNVIQSCFIGENRIGFLVKKRLFWRQQQQVKFNKQKHEQVTIARVTNFTKMTDELFDMV